jgi:DNA-directed RNA polymerase sigma subunit (sigma70/sigma32)
MEKQHRDGWSREEALEQKSMQEQVDKWINELPLNQEPLEVINRRRAKVGLALISKAEYDAAHKAR